MARCSDLAYCQGSGAVFNIGELSDAPYPYSARVLFTDVATGRLTEIDNEGAGTTITIDTEDFTPIAGHTYTVKVVLTAEGGGVVAAYFKPYTLTAGNSFAVGVDEYISASVTFVKVFDVDGEVTESTEQWLTLKG